MRNFFFPVRQLATKEIVLKMSITPLKAFIMQNGGEIVIFD